MILKLKILLRKLYLTMSTYDLPVIYISFFILKDGKKIYNFMCTGTLAIIHIIHSHEFFLWRHLFTTGCTFLEKDMH